MSAKWIDAEDKLLRQLTSIGLNAKQYVQYSASGTLGKSYRTKTLLFK